MTTCSGKILVTAFEDLFAIKKYVSISGRNRSDIVLSNLKEDCALGNLACESLKFKNYLQSLGGHLASGPVALVMLGELQSPDWRTYLEPYARNPHDLDDHLPSLAATKLAPVLKARGLTFKTQIQNQQCNHAYWTGLHWGQKKERPVVFIHLGVLGPLGQQTKAVIAVLQEINCLAFSS